MVKRLSGRELPILRFIKHFGILGILQWEFMFDLLSSLDEGSGKCELSDICMISLLVVNPNGIFRFISFNCS